MSCRLLLKNDLHIVSIQLATTAIEKLFKSFLNFVHNEKVDERIHKPSELYEYGEVYFKHHEIEVDMNFLKWLDYVYFSRYSSDLYPGKVISFGTRHFLYNLDMIFYQVFNLYTKMNEELSQLYFAKDRLKMIQKDNQLYSKIDKTRWLKQPQRVVKAMFMGGRRTDVIFDMYFYNPSNAFLFEDGVVDAGALQVPLDFGVITDVEMRALNRKYWLIRKVRFLGELVVHAPMLMRLLYFYRIKPFFSKNNSKGK